jgi:hypothetical protein
VKLSDVANFVTDSAKSVAARALLQPLYARAEDLPELWPFRSPESQASAMQSAAKAMLRGLVIPVYNNARTGYELMAHGPEHVNQDIKNNSKHYGGLYYHDSPKKSKSKPQPATRPGKGGKVEFFDSTDANKLSHYSRPVSSKQPNKPNNNKGGAMAPKRGKKAKNAPTSGRTTRRPGRTLGIPRSIGPDGVRIPMRGTVDLLNTANTVLAHYRQLGSNTSGLLSITNYISKLLNFYGMYDWARITRLKLTYTPNVGYSEVGWFGMAIDPNPRAVAPAALTHVTRHYHSVSGDIKNEHVLDLSQRQLEQLGSGNMQWYTTDNTADEEWRCPGVLQLYSKNTQLSGVSIGQLIIEAVVEFKGLTEA